MSQKYFILYFLKFPSEGGQKALEIWEGPSEIRAQTAVMCCSSGLLSAQCHKKPAGFGLLLQLKLLEALVFVKIIWERLKKAAAGLWSECRYFLVLVSVDTLNN